MVDIKQFDKPDKYIPFSPPWFDVEEEKAVLDVLRSGWVTTGPKTTELEKNIAEYVGAKWAVATFSCTDAMLIALKVLNLEPDDEVITTPYTFAATAHVILYHRARPVFVDVEGDTFNIDPKKIEEKITSKTRVIMPVDFAGQPCDLDGIREIARRRNIHIVEDAAHAFGSEYKGRRVGGLADITCFSFYATKNLATGEGGMATTNNPEWAERMRRLTRFGISDARQIWHKRHQEAGAIHYDIMELGYKCNLTDISAALGLCQLKKLPVFNDIRSKFAYIYNRAFAKESALTIPIIKEYAKTNRHLYPLLLNLDNLKITRDEFIDKLKAFNIGTSVLFKPLHLHSFYANNLPYKYGDFPVAESLFERVVCLPISPKLGEAVIHQVADAVLFLIAEHKR